ncbi:hypothetical protein MUK42_36483 [Musa troglodytarum]|uniref:Uncharacterized protein n=1 Tax=Musa troglodytarum TaxID=320322 RepID=A0A9E7JBQ8_9LILI|nr:hypothetical protein MUK42_36483 [Musa troglodytarum]
MERFEPQPSRVLHGRRRDRWWRKVMTHVVPGGTAGSEAKAPLETLQPKLQAFTSYDNAQSQS